MHRFEHARVKMVFFVSLLFFSAANVFGLGLAGLAGRSLSGHKPQARSAPLPLPAMSINPVAAMIPQVSALGALHSVSGSNAMDSGRAVYDGGFAPLRREVYLGSARPLISVGGLSGRLTTKRGASSSGHVFGQGPQVEKDTPLSRRVKEKASWREGESFGYFLYSSIFSYGMYAAGNYMGLPRAASGAIAAAYLGLVAASLWFKDRPWGAAILVFVVLTLPFLADSTLVNRLLEFWPQF